MTFDIQHYFCIINGTHFWEILGISLAVPLAKQQELSYHTQNAEGIYDNPVTLKSRLMVTQGHRKWNH